MNTKVMRKPWVNLTDKEIMDEYCFELIYLGDGEYDIDVRSIYKFARAIELKLEEKNECNS